MICPTAIIFSIIPLAASLAPDRPAPSIEGVTTDRTLPTTSCEARTINYITHSLPQFCLTSAWPSPKPTSTEVTVAAPEASSRDGVVSDAPDSPSSVPAASVFASASDASSDVVGSDPASTPFMSFEDWKEMMLRRTGQDPQDLRLRKPNQARADDRTPPDMGSTGLGEEDEISLNFDTYMDDLDGDADAGTGTPTDSHKRDEVEDAVVFEDGPPSAHRSKDAGKTCKERFSYSSFDAGATVLKTSLGAKNAKAILIENKDSYMLLECAAKSKFVIVELSDDILIDTVVLANFEFFSSMIRLFRVSVSDRYPVKTERWRELGRFEARNSRDIQPFLVENPQIWAKYVRIDFVTHYGNEYYCPVSLLRVHGSRMLDSWKESETGRDEDTQPEDEVDEIHASSETAPVEASRPVEEPNELAPIDDATPPFASVSSPSQCALIPVWDLLLTPPLVCPTHAEEVLSQAPTPQVDHPPDTTGGHPRESAGSPSKQKNSTTVAPQASTAVSSGPEESSTSADAVPSTPTPAEASSSGPGPSQVPPTQPVSPSSSPTSASASAASDSAAHSMSSTSVSSSSSNDTTTVIQRSPAPSASTGKNRTTTTTNSPAASPTVQESFFKAITKRLQQVEANLTLSLQYVEDQARHMQDTLQRTESKQLNKVAAFLDTLNQTVLGELRNVRGQYDEIWQSTVIALESQRDLSEREIVALSTRLNVLADEVIFQKRMAIVQAVLLLSCLLLVIFSRGVPIPSLGPLLDQANAPSFESLSTASLRTGMRRAGVDIGRHREALLDLHPEDVDKAMLRSGQESYIGPDLPCDHLHIPEPPAASRECQRLTMPVSPSAANKLLPPHHAPINPTEQTITRKPLPALPENPSSP